MKRILPTEILLAAGPDRRQDSEDWAQDTADLCTQVISLPDSDKRTALVALAGTCLAWLRDIDSREAQSA